jgi:hypothetical protein
VEIDRHHLPEDPRVLQQMVVRLLAERDSQEQRLRQVQHLLEQLLRARYGPRRERVSEHQLFLFAVTILSARPATPPAPDKSETPSAPRPGHGRQRLPQTLERRRVIYDLGEQERQCPQCQGELRRIGEEISERLEYVPASLQVIEEACQKYACAQGCTVVTAAKPMQTIEKGIAGPGLLAQVAATIFPCTARKRSSSGTGWNCLVRL